MDIPELKWGRLQLVQKWIVIAEIILCLVLWHHLMFSNSIFFPLEVQFALYTILIIGIIIIYKWLLQFQKKKAKQELAELLQVATAEAKRIKKQQLELSEELMQELDDCVYELRESYGMTV